MRASSPPDHPYFRIVAQLTTLSGARHTAAISGQEQRYRRPDHAHTRPAGPPAAEGPKAPDPRRDRQHAVSQEVRTTGPDGRERIAHAHELVCLWYKPFYMRAIKVILIRNPGTTYGFESR
ncbi:MAG: hypothetical protein M3Y17_10700 [Actinomycetota bacterium]|nr:hypothetical protein [Actinomycetota bacterium]